MKIKALALAAILTPVLTLAAATETKTWSFTGKTDKATVSALKKTIKHSTIKTEGTTLTITAPATEETAILEATKAKGLTPVTTEAAPATKTETTAPAKTETAAPAAK